MSISLQVRNLFDERYIESGRQRSRSFFGSPTAALLTVRGRFDGQSLEKAVDAVKDLAGKVGDLFK